MSSRYKTRRRIHVLVGGVGTELRQSTASPPGFSVYDTQDGVELPGSYVTENAAELEADRLNAEHLRATRS